VQLGPDKGADSGTRSIVVVVYSLCLLEGLFFMMSVVPVAMDGKTCLNILMHLVLAQLQCVCARPFFAP
jgi:hypothetical protein